MAIKKKRDESIFNLALLYDKNNKRKLIRKYYSMTIIKGDIISINCLVMLHDE